MKRSKKQARKLAERLADWARMAAAPKIGDGHREINGYKKPGSRNK